MPASTSSTARTVLDDVGHDECEGEEEQAQDEVAEPAVTFATGDRAGQNAIATQMMSPTMPSRANPLLKAQTLRSFRCRPSISLRRRGDSQPRMSAPGVVVLTLALRLSR